MDWDRVFRLDVSVAEIFVRGTVVYLGLIALLRVILRRQSGSLGTGDMLLIVLIADASQNAMAGEYKSVPAGLILAGTLIFWNYAIDWIAYHSRAARRWLEPEPLPLIRDGVILGENLSSQQITEEELMAQLREKGIVDPAKVLLANLEGEGKVSVIAFPEDAVAELHAMLVEQGRQIKELRDALLYAQSQHEAKEMTTDPRFLSERFPRASRYHPDWVIASASGGANSLHLAEWLTGAMDLRPGMRVLDLGCGRAASSIFLHREFGVQVWATDLWFSATENLQRVRDAGAEAGVFPIHADARSLPFAAAFFDAVVCIDSFFYFGTDDLYLNTLAGLVKPGGALGIAGAGLVKEIDGAVPEALCGWWTQDLWCLHSAAWWRRHWERTGIVDVETADTMPDGWRVWLDWHTTAFPDNAAEIRALEADAGRTMGYARVVARRRGDAKLEPMTNVSIPADYVAKPLLRG